MSMLHKLADQQEDKPLEILKAINEGADPDKTVKGQKAIYHAVRHGNAEATIILADFTTLDDMEYFTLKKIVHTKIAKEIDVTRREPYERVRDALDNKNLYDHLWDNNASFGENLLKIFKDYYAPVRLSFFQSPRTQRILTGHWHRHHINIANKIIKNLETHRPESLKKKTKSFIMATVEDFIEDAAEKLNSNYTGSFFRRWIYILRRSGQYEKIPKEILDRDYNFFNQDELNLNDNNKEEEDSVPLKTISSS